MIWKSQTRIGLNSRVSGLSAGGNKTINFEWSKCVSAKGGGKLYIRKVLIVTKLALVLVLCFVIVRTVIMPQHPAEIFTPVSVVGTENVSANGTENAVETSVEDYSAIVERDIFGIADSSPMADKSLPDIVTRSAEEELGLALLGTVCGSTDVSRAIIQDNKTKMLNLYKTGQNVGDARIKSIEENAVILLHNGQRKMLTLNRTGGHNKNNTQVLSSPAIRETGKVARPVLPVKQPFTEVPTRTAHVVAMLTKAVIEPYDVNGQVEGLRITGLENIPMAKAFGLKDGDIIREVNGHRLTGKQMALQVFKKARSQPTMSLELLRDGETKEMSFALQ
jgi:type II secretion system protein C